MLRRQILPAGPKDRPEFPRLRKIARRLREGPVIDPRQGQFALSGYPRRPRLEQRREQVFARFQLRHADLDGRQPAIREPLVLPSYLVEARFRPSLGRGVQKAPLRRRERYLPEVGLKKWMPSSTKSRICFLMR